MEYIPAEPSSTEWHVSRVDLFHRLQSCSFKNKQKQFDELVNFVQNNTNCSSGEIDNIKVKIAKFNAEFRSKWTKSNRMKNRFIENNKQWLEGRLQFTNYGRDTFQRGRPNLSFAESSERSKRRKTLNLRQKFSEKELAYATQMSLRASRQTDAAKVVRDVTLTSPKRAQKYRQAFRRSNIISDQQITPDAALSMIIEAKLTRHQYNVVRSNAKKNFPCYSYVQRAKQNCYPDKEAISVTETAAEIKLQALLDHTTARLIKCQEEVFNSYKLNENLSLISKWGLDGTNTAQYHQKFETEGGSDTSVFITSLVPLQLSGMKDGKPVIIWKNLRPSSTRYCRPIKFIYQKETVDVTTNEKNRVDIEINELEKTETEVNERQYKTQHTLLFTMIDGKVCNAVTETKYTQRCYICNLTSNDFSNLEKCVSAPVKEENLEFGLSILHAWIRFMEMLLHVSYNLPLKKWKIPKAEKDVKESRKRYLQKQFQDKLGLIIDQPKQSFGNTNNGNMARRFFKNYQIKAQITQLDEDLIKRLYTILQTISCDFQINLTKFQDFCLETARKYIALYGWYPMPPSVHKILIHGPTVIEKVLLPIGQLSEEAQEARNKDFKKYREDFSRKTSRLKTNEDVINRLLISSDPYITSLRKIPPKQYKILPAEVLNMLRTPEGSEPFTLGSDSELISDGSDSE